MKMRTLTAVAFAATALSATAAAAQDASWYVQGNVGGNYQSQVNGHPSAKGDTGWTVSGAAGREISDGFRGEGEVVYLDSSGKHAGSGDLKTIAGMVNGYYD